MQDKAALQAPEAAKDLEHFRLQATLAKFPPNYLFSDTPWADREAAVTAALGKLTQA